jgi:hypothetical protein
MLSDLAILLDRPPTTLKKMLATGRLCPPRWVSSGGHHLWAYGDVLAWAKATGATVRPVALLADIPA